MVSEAGFHTASGACRPSRPLLTAAPVLPARMTHSCPPCVLTLCPQLARRHWDGGVLALRGVDAVRHHRALDHIHCSSSSGWAGGREVSAGGTRSAPVHSAHPG